MKKLQKFVDWFMPALCLSLLAVLVAYHSGLVNWAILTFRAPVTLGESFALYTASLSLLVIIKIMNKIRLQ